MTLSNITDKHKEEKLPETFSGAHNGLVCSAVGVVLIVG